PMLHSFPTRRSSDLVRREAVGCFLRLLPIALHDLRSSYAEFANCADPEALAIFIADDHIRGWDRDADGSAELLVTEAICGNDGRGFRQAVAFLDRAA